MGRFTYEERMKMLMAAMEFCPDCQREMIMFAQGRGMNLFTLIREVIWKWYGQWAHGAGCPQPEALATATPEAQTEQRLGPGAAPSAARSAAVGGSIPSNPEPSMVLQDPEAGQLG